MDTVGGSALGRAAAGFGACAGRSDGGGVHGVGWGWIWGAQRGSPSATERIPAEDLSGGSWDVDA